VSFLASGSLTSDSLKILAVNIAGVALWFCLHLVLARWLSVENYGIYVYALSWITILLVVVQLGFNTSTVRIISEQRSRNDYPGMRGMFSFSGQVVAGVGAVTVIAGLGTIWATKHSMSDVEIRTLIFMLPTAVVMALMYQRAYFLHGLMAIISTQIVVDVARPLLLIAACLGVVLVGPDHADAMMIVTFVITSVTFLVVSRLAAKRLASIGDRSSDSTRQPREWLSVSVPYLGIGALTAVILQTDVLMVGTLDSTKAAGVYLPALKLAMLITFPLMALRSRAAPEISAQFAGGNLQQVQRTLSVVFKASVISGALLAAAIIWQREFLLSIFGPEFVSAAPVVVVLSLGVLASCMTNGVETLLIFGPFERHVLTFFGAIAMANALLNGLLIPHWGILGAATATAVTMGLRGLFAVVFIRLRTGISPFALSNARAGA